jgi:hypothetical protein
MLALAWGPCAVRRPEAATGEQERNLCHFNRNDAARPGVSALLPITHAPHPPDLPMSPPVTYRLSPQANPCVISQHLLLRRAVPI